MQKKENATAIIKSLAAIGNDQQITPGYKAVHNRTARELIHSLVRLSLLLIIFSFTYKAYAQDKAVEVDKIFNWAKPSTPGCACVISQNGNVVLERNYGSADLERNVSISGETRFDIGSTRKQFIAASVLLLVQDKRLALSDDIRKYIPDLPDYSSKITVDHLLTHTSGIRDWTGILPLASGDPSALSLILKQRNLNFAPGEEWSYSNSGYVLLIEIVERISGMPFSKFITDRLFEPLGMKHTLYWSDAKQTVENKAIGYAKNADGWKVNMYLGNDRGGGAIFSTSNDLTLWNNALSAGKLGPFVSGKIIERTTLNNGRQLSYARGLILEPNNGSELVSHSGSAAGYHSWLGRIPSQGLSIAVLCNSDAMPASAIANRLLALYVNSPGTSSTESGPPPTLTGEALAQTIKNSGVYFNEQTGVSLKLIVDRDRFRVAGGPGLTPASQGGYRRWGNSVFFMSEDKFTLNFLAPDVLELKSMEGKVSLYKKLQPHVHSEEELKNYAGRYQSEEVSAFFDIEIVNSILSARLNDATGKGFEFTPIGRDTFQFSGIIMRFIRDKEGKITALDYSNPVVRKIKFSRLPSGVR